VLDRDNECSDFSDDETESEISSIGSDDESSEKDSGEKNDAPGPSKRFRTTTQKKQWLEVDQNWQQSSDLPLY
jgi:hypothetical protein